jgi:hypothetical protein
MLVVPAGYAPQRAFRHQEQPVEEPIITALIISVKERCVHMLSNANRPGKRPVFALVGVIFPVQMH